MQMLTRMLTHAHKHTRTHSRWEECAIKFASNIRTACATLPSALTRNIFSTNPGSFLAVACGRRALIFSNMADGALCSVELYCARAIKVFLCFMVVCTNTITCQNDFAPRFKSTAITHHNHVCVCSMCFQRISAVKLSCLSLPTTA